MDASPTVKTAGPANSREASKASQRPRILDAITELVADRGYAGTTLRDIAGLAGVSLTTFYEHFADKGACFLAAYDRVADELLSAITNDALAASNPWEGLDAGIARYFTWFAEHPTAAATFVVEVHTAGSQALDRRAEIHQRYQAFIASAAEALAQECGQEVKLPASSAAAASTIDAMTHDYVRQRRTDELPGLVPEAQKLARHILRI